MTFVTTRACCLRKHPLMRFFVVFIPSMPAPLVAPRNLAPAVETSFSPAVIPLLMLRRPAVRAWTGTFRQQRGCSVGAVKREQSGCFKTKRKT